MNLLKPDIDALEKPTKIRLMNSITGAKPANLIGSISNSDTTNLAIFSSIVHLGSDPAILGFITRAHPEKFKHTFQNILEIPYYTINSIHLDFVEKAHFTSYKFKKEESEFDKCLLNEEYLNDFKAPFVRESRIKIGMKYAETVEIKTNNTKMVVGEIQQITLPTLDIDLETLWSAKMDGSEPGQFYEFSHHPHIRSLTYSKEQHQLYWICCQNRQIQRYIFSVNFNYVLTP